MGVMRFRARLISGLCMFALVCACANAQAQREIKRKKKVALMSEQAYDGLVRIHNAIEAGAFSDALGGLQAMEQSELSGYERALVLQTYGFLYAQNDYLDEALLYFEACIALDALPLEAQQAMLYSLASLYAQRERWAEAVDTIEYWLIGQPEPPREAYILIASSYAGLERYPETLEWIKKAINGADAPEESWYQLMVVSHFELKQYAQAAAAARTLVALWPAKKNNWQMLQGAYQEAGDELGMLSALQLAYEHGLLVEQSDILNLVRTLLYMELPFDAAELLTREIGAGRVEGSNENLELVLSGWEAAREFDRAMAVIDQMAASAPTGKLYARKAQLFSERFEWEKVIGAVDQALKRGGMSSKDQGTVLLLKGVALLELERAEDAEKIFMRALSLGGRAAEQARSWILFLKDRGRVLSEG